MAMEQSGAKGEGFATISTDGRVLDSWFLQLRLSAEVDGAATARLTERKIKELLGESANGYARHDDIPNVDIVPIRPEIGSLAAAPVDAHDAYLRLHLLSHRL